VFIGRKKELDRLNELYAGGNFECAVIYGRRRVGKTTLINEFIRNKKTIFFTGEETSTTENLESFSRSIMAFTRSGGGEAPVFANFQAALDEIYGLAKKERIVLVIDEYPYLAASYRGFSSILQRQIDHKFKGASLMLILCGSSMSFMENQVLGYISPLYGRRTAQFKITAFNFFETRELCRGFSGEDAAVVYGITGGIPQYVSLFNGKLSLGENIKRNFLDPSSYLFEEPSNLLKQELREAALYNAVIRAIASGSTKVSEIASRTGMESGAASSYLKNLISLGIVLREEPVGEASRRKSLYRLADGMFRFWYRFIPENSALVRGGMAEHAWERIKPQIPAFMGSVFEDICAQWLWRENAAGKLSVQFTRSGRWWGNDPVRKQAAEIDILCLAEQAAIFGECKWTNSLVSHDVLNTLAERAALFAYTQKFLYLFAKKGFTQKCKKEAEKTGVRLVAFSEMG
jgi:AAA+ ATPase superfamily predicted ATPase